MARKREGAAGMAEDTVTFVPAVTFIGWPMPYAENRKGVVFIKGVESLPVPASFAALMREKGLVEETETETANEPSITELGS